MLGSSAMDENYLKCKSSLPIISFEKDNNIRIIYQDYHTVSPRQRLLKLPVKQSPILRLNGICPYYTMFPLDFPFKQLLKASPGEWVLDPFCGRGTTNFAARLLGLPSVGIDSNPVAVAIAAAKIVSVEASDVVELCKSILSNNDGHIKIPKGRFWELCYHPDTLRQICILREELMKDCSTKERIALRALLLGILHGPRMKQVQSYLSNQMPRTYATKPNSAIKFWESKGMIPEYVDVVNVVTRRANHLFEEVPTNSAGMIIQSDSRNLPMYIFSQKFKWVITSPPYFGMETYLPDQWLRNWFLGGDETVKYGDKNQISRGSETTFIKELSKVWIRISMVCDHHAHLIIRFGGLPCYNRDPSFIIRESIKIADCGWKVTTVRSAGRPTKGRRQAEQFSNGRIGNAVEEIDVYARLEY